MALKKDVKTKIIREFARDEKDTGSPEVQIAVLTARINALTEHLKNNKQEKVDIFIATAQKKIGVKFRHRGRSKICLDCVGLVSTTLKDGIKFFDTRLHGFANPDSILTGMETRSSSPVRILRDENLEASIKGIYPCGEGAGYAGGITTSAMDGMKIFESIYKTYKN